MVYCVSDTHFGHTKVCYGYPEHFAEPRNYETVEDMENDIVNTWNSTVDADDEVIFLGDFLFGGTWEYKKPRIIELWSKLNGRKTWVIGNHDFSAYKHRDELPGIDFEVAIDREIDGRVYHFQHEPFLREEMVADEVYVHGHTHSTNPWNNGQNCACWDAWYAPVPVDVFKTPAEMEESMDEVGKITEKLNNEE